MTPVTDHEPAVPAPATTPDAPGVRPGTTVTRGTARDPATLLRRLGRHVPFGTDRVLVGVIRLSRGYVERAGWFAAAPGPVPAADLHAAVLACLAPLAPPRPTIPPTHAVAMVRCRRGRVVWLPTDDAWVSALTAEAGRHRLPVAETFLLTEHGWRCRTGTAAGCEPALNRT
ncbi:hypothetical protein SAMN05421678_107178 [Actinopolymorpha cephalotaxi]|uniref:Uncharacterized protein n=1 Tax=Actinopolymorpha cephalotaxi TaxID=504797 RepID=A0A1I2TFW3_9ACTN|nr:hypothetical protein [Actinopolymorpha cephalotaxi]NYH83072.1 hypothetical protein [Actinopolymorpha cephalotaxi]SFG63852.1 hypothetical protein SAMN05421678_107178 [Actinopolymorpha cephalotaxi]